ncbi:MAG: hypothetical protein ABIL09_19940 [Gemmatimonadota bacterium]
MPEEARDQGGAASGEGGESRRHFIKKLPYVAPVIESFFLSETVYGQSTDNQGRGRGRVSKPPKDKKDKSGETAPPPPPPPPPG